MKYIIGCSGFHYKHWKGKFYPEKLAVKQWFNFYCQNFSTLELNVTFYRFPKISTLQQWYEKSPGDFIFSVKVPRSITHFKKLNHTARMVSDFYCLVQQGLKEKLGSVLFQFPPNFVFSDQHLERIIASVDPSFENVVEFRHASWWKDVVLNKLAEHQIAFCGMSHPDFPDELIANTSHVYYRMHGRKQLYASAYSQAEMSDIINRLKSFGHIKRAYIYFNNDVNGYATDNAKALISITEKSK
jgi:uncharacterized protein YecE (DUF72 family)